MFGSGSGGFSFGGGNTGSSGLGSAASSTGNNAGGGFNFGSSNNNNNNNNTAPSTGNIGGSGSLFGGSSGSNAGSTGGSTGFSFGNSNAPTTQPSTGGGLFGAKPAAQATNSTSGGLFGSNTNAASNQPSSTTGGGLFGSNNNSNQTGTTTGGGLFGSNNSAPTSTTGGGLFGSNTSTQPANTGGLFGSNNTTNQPTSGGLFGSNTTNTNANTSGGLFGNTQNNSQPQLQQPTAASTQTGQPSFAWSQPSSSQQNNNLQQQQQPLSFASNVSQDPRINSNDSVTIQEQLSKIKNSWDPTSQQTALKTFFYNTVPENQSALYTKPANENEEWDKAYNNKPSNNSIPVRAVGFGDLQKRSQTQINHVAQARVILQQISEKNKMLSDKHDLDTASRIIAAKGRHSRISKRILRFASTLAVLKSKGYQLSPNEEKLIQTFQKLLNESQDPSGLGKSNELWARLAVLKEKAKSLSDQLDNTLGIQKLDNNNVDDINDSEQKQTQILKIAQVLQQQQNGIKYLSEIIEDDEKIVQKVLK